MPSAVPYIEKEGQWLEIKRINNQIFIYKILSHEKNYSTAEEISRDLIGDTIHVGTGKDWKGFERARSKNHITDF